MELLDEKGFVFIDDGGKPYLICMWGKSPWMFYWHPDKKWVSLRRVNQFEIFKFSNKKISDEQRKIYDSSS